MDGMTDIYSIKYPFIFILKEISNAAIDIVTARTASSPFANVYIHEPKTKVDMTKTIDTHRFTFDNVFDETSTNEELYKTTTEPLVQGALNGAKSTLFAYGQTGTIIYFLLLNPFFFF